MFSGIGGFELGIQRAYELQSKNERLQVETNSGGNNGELLQRTASCIGYSEIDKYAIKVYERNFNDRRNKGWGEQSIKERQQTSEHELHPESIIGTPHNTGGHKNYGDATTIKPEELPDFDLLVGGFPCQAFSIAGKRKGFDDTRGTLFFDIARILAEKKPKHLVLENVKGLLSHEQGRTFQTIIGVLSDLGYRVEWQVLNSKDFGVPQNRERVIIVGHLGAECRGQVFPITGTNGKDIEQLNQPRHSNDRVYGTDGVSPTLNTMQGGNRQPFVKIKKNGEPKASQAIAATLTGGGHSGGNHSDMDLLKFVNSRIRRLTPKECERLQGFPDDWTKYGVRDEPISDTQRYKMCGNAVTTNVIQAVITNLIECLN